MNPYLEGMIRYAETFIGVPYIFGGNNPLIGLDCSGLACVLLRYAGLIGLHEDLSAQGIFDKFKTRIHLSEPVGSFLFYGKTPKEITHISFKISPYTVIEAGGGDSRTTSLDKAIDKNAFVRAISIQYRKDLIASIYPQYPWDSNQKKAI